MVGRHRCGTGAVGIKVELAFLDAVFHLATLTVNRLVQLLSADLLLAGSEVTMKRGLEPFARCSALATTRRLRDQLSLRTIVELLEDASGLGRLRGRLSGLGQLSGDHRFQPPGCGRAQTRIPRGSPRTRLISSSRAKPLSALEPDLDLRPGLTHVRHDACDVFFRAGRSVDVGFPELGNEQMSPIEDSSGR